MRLSTFSRATPLFAVAAVLALFAVAACGSDDEEDVGGAAPTPVPTLVTIPTADPDAPGGEGGDSAIARGQTLFATKGCSACHSTGDNQVIGPGLAGIGDRAVSRVAGLTADSYLEEAIRDPGTFLVEGFANLMPPIFADLPDSEVEELIAYLKSL
ncbi:MAG: cytochrome c [Chloroflexi bacterium]|nr:cytochrome c [Chloroflexota bacterium]